MIKWPLSLIRMKRHIYQRTVLESFYCLLRVSVWFVSLYMSYIPKIIQEFLGWKWVSGKNCLRSSALEHLPKAGVRLRERPAELYSGNADTSAELRLPHWRKRRSGRSASLSLKALSRWVWKLCSSLCDLSLQHGTVLYTPRRTREKTSTAFVLFACLFMLFPL